MTLMPLLSDAATQPAPNSQPVPFWANQQTLLFLAIGVIFIFMIMGPSRARKNEQKTRDDMLKNLKRGDRVMTIGGMLGSVVEVKDNEVVLKVDESSNTKIKFSRDAIKQAMGSDSSST